jgi:citronellol/citronellal dehydrogenase
LPIQLDIRDDEATEAAFRKAAQHFGGIDIVVNNASAINLAPVEKLEMKRFDLMHQINARGTYLVSRCGLPYLAKAANPHILMLSPPLDMKTKWFAGHTGYSMAKFGMSLVVLGLAGETKGRIGVNALWPRTTIATAAVNNLLGGEALMRASRTPQILADAAYMIFNKDAKTFSGNFIIDDTFMAGEGVSDFDIYRNDPTSALAPDFFVPDDIKPPSVASYGPLKT